MIALFVLPHIDPCQPDQLQIMGNYRHSFWSEIYETVLAWYMAPPTLVALINPHKGTLTHRQRWTGGRRYVDWVISGPTSPCPAQPGGRCGRHLRYFYGPPTEMLTVVVSMVWVSTT
ncbi:hypothetical protein ACNKHP_12000 [Shigella boydii]